MRATVPASLDTAALSRRLGELAGHERELQVEFLLHLEEFDRRRAYADTGYSSLWDYLTNALHYREGATHRRIRAMRAVRRVRGLGDALRDGRLCLTTLAVLEPVLTPENADDLVARAAYASKLDVERLAAMLQPKPAPRDGLRAMPRVEHATDATMSAAPSDVAVADGAIQQERAPMVATASCPPAARPTLQAVSAEEFSLRVTIDAELKADLDTLKALLSHKVPNGDLRAVLREAVRCAIEEHGKRKGAVEPKRARSTPKAKAGDMAATAPASRSPSAEVRRQVWKRDGGRCAWIAPDGRRCGSRWKLEFDHVEAAALGGSPTVENCRLLCRTHNLAHAEETFGVEHMQQFRRNANGSRRESIRETASSEMTPRTNPTHASPSRLPLGEGASPV